MRCRSLDCSYLVFKWLNMPVVVPSSWSISNTKVTLVKVTQQFRKIEDRELYKSGYRGIALLNRIPEFRVRTRVE